MTIIGVFIIIGVIAGVIYAFKGDLDGIIERQSDTPPEDTAKAEAETVKTEYLRIQQQPIVQWQDGDSQGRFNITESVEIVGRQNGFCCSWMEKKQLVFTTDTANGIYRIKNLSKKIKLYCQDGENYREVTEELTLTNAQKHKFIMGTMEFCISIPEIS